MRVTLKEVLKIEKPILRNFYSLYLHELSNFTKNLDIGEDGLFHYDELNDFWDVDGLSPYFIKLDGEIIGFTLLLERPFLTKKYDYGINDFLYSTSIKVVGWLCRPWQKYLKRNQGNILSCRLWKISVQLHSGKKYIIGCILNSMKDKI